MDVCKVNSWVPYKMVALGQGGKCAGGYIFHFFQMFHWCSHISHWCSHVFDFCPCVPKIFFHRVCLRKPAKGADMVERLHSAQGAVTLIVQRPRRHMLRLARRPWRPLGIQALTSGSGFLLITRRVTRGWCLNYDSDLYIYIYIYIQQWLLITCYSHENYLWCNWCNYVLFLKRHGL